ncbi:cupin [Kitasatospora phosalacinea]|uniref:Cupin n=1 Tax=Kitasatospora phosalacinea TaxID=2065 RepID=A0A9W6V7C7_9ACTN|nr:cupin domain-containing protein [Kitasatospora phosalacinea]GLW75080.1 cupin [Kitasatospora phosalacinea]
MTDTERTAGPSTEPELSRQARTIRLGPGGSTVEVLATPAETGGAVSVYRWRMAPSGRGPDPHFHTTFGETFVVEQGEVAHFDGRSWRTLRPGDTAHAAAGGVHALRKENAGPAVLLMVLTPGVPREEYFAQLATADEQDLDRLHRDHDNHFVAPRGR